jgi:hypothetical protein
MRLWPCFCYFYVLRYPADQWLRMRRLKNYRFLFLLGY